MPEMPNASPATAKVPDGETSIIRIQKRIAKGRKKKIGKPRSHVTRAQGVNTVPGRNSIFLREPALTKDFTLREFTPDFVKPQVVHPLPLR